MVSHGPGQVCETCLIMAALGVKHGYRLLSSAMVEHVRVALDRRSDEPNQYQLTGMWRETLEALKGQIAAAVEPDAREVFNLPGTSGDLHLICQSTGNATIKNWTSGHWGNMQSLAIGRIHDAFGWRCPSPHPGGD